MEKTKSLKGGKLILLLCATLLVFCFAAAVSANGVSAGVAVTVNFDAGADFKDKATNLPDSLSWTPGIGDTAKQTMPSEVPSADGVVFLGWSYDGYEGEPIQPGSEFEFTSDKVKHSETGDSFTFTAVWGISVTYNKNMTDATVTVVSDPADLFEKTFDASYKIAFKTAKALTAPDYTFMGWSKDADTAANDTTKIIKAEADIPAEEMTSNVVLYAIWKANFLKVTYHANTGTEASDASVTVPLDYNHYAANNIVKVLGASSNNTVTSGASISTQATTSTASDANLSQENATKNYTDAVMARTGYTFAGWATAPNSSVVAYKPGATFTITADTDLYAVWTNGAADGATATTTTPQTGEEDNLLLYSVVALIALMGIVYLCYDRRKVKAGK